MKKRRSRRKRKRNLSDIKPRLPMEAVLLLRKKAIEAPVVKGAYNRLKEKVQFHKDISELGLFSYVLNI